MKRTVHRRVLQRVRGLVPDGLVLAGPVIKSAAAGSVVRLAAVVLVACIGLTCGGLLHVGLTGLAAADSPQVTTQDLAWLVAGLDELTQTRDQKLTITKDQAVQLFPILRELREEGILRFSMTRRMGDLTRADAAAAEGRVEAETETWTGDEVQQRGQMWVGSPVVPDRMPAQLQSQMLERNQRMNDVMDEILLLLTLDQCDYILNMEFDASQIGLAGTGGSGWDRALPGAGRENTDQEAIQKALEETAAKAEQFDEKVVGLLKQLAALSGTTYEEAE